MVEDGDMKGSETPGRLQRYGGWEVRLGGYGGDVLQVRRCEDSAVFAVLGVGDEESFNRWLGDVLDTPSVMLSEYADADLAFRWALARLKMRKA